MAKSGASASASSDFSGKDIIGYAAVLAAITTVSGCISPTTTTTTVTETNKTEVQHSASGEEGKPTPDVTTTTTTSVTKHDTTTTTPIAAYDPATFEVPKEHEPLPHNQRDHLFATPGDAVGVSTTPREGTTDRSDFWVVYEGISKVDGETVKIMVGDNGKAKEIDAPRYVANFDMWEYSTASNKVVGPTHTTLEATLNTDPSVRGGYGYGTPHTGLESFEGRAGVLLALNAIYSGNSDKDQAATCEFLTPLDEKVNGVGCFMTDGKMMEYILNAYLPVGEKDLSADDKLFLNNVKTMIKYDSENPQGYAIVSISTNSPCISKSGNC